jgi:hypothetical protein
MNKKHFMMLIVLGVLAATLAGCTSVPKVEKEKKIAEGKYDVVVDRDYMKDPKELEYAFNSFVMKKGGDSYDVEKYGPNDFYITIPGSTEVRDLPKTRHFHLGRTLGLTIPPTAVGLVLLLLLL